MAGGSTKRTAANNEAVIKNLHITFYAVSFSSLALRFIFKRIGTHSPFSHWFQLALPFLPSYSLYLYLVGIGKPKRDATGILTSPGSDLNQSGLTEWAFDVLYITWICQVGSAILGPWIWLLYLSIPGFFVFKVWNMFLKPYFSAGLAGALPVDEQPTQSKRQQKLQQRAERGDSRVSTVRTVQKR